MAILSLKFKGSTIFGISPESNKSQRFLQAMQERLQAFGLTLHPDKTQLIRFGRHAISDRNRLGERKPETFDFLGFTHFCTQSRKNGAFVIGRQTIKKRLRATLHAIKSELRKRWHDPLPKTGEWIQRVLQGHLNYFAVSGNDASIWLFFNEVRRLWLHRIRRRSQKGYMSWDRFVRITSRFFPRIRLLHPHPCYRFDVRTQGRSPVR
jgi:RNA-directed DNA polymerase